MDSSPPPGADVGTLLEEYRRSWQSGRRPQLRNFLRRWKGHPRYDELALWVAKVHLEHQLRAGDEAPLVEHVIADLEAAGAHLAPNPRCELIWVEYDGRWGRGEPGVSRLEYQERFPQFRDAVGEWVPLWTCPRCAREDIPLEAEGAEAAVCPNPKCRERHAVTDLFRVPVKEWGLDSRAYEFDMRLDRLDAGGMGEVYRSRDPGLGRDLAVKVIHRHLHGDREGEWRFVQEAKLTSRLEHPNIVPVHSIGRRGEDQRLFYTMKLVRGQTLERKLAACGDDLKKRLDACLDDFERVCQAVAYAHSRGVIHRDLKPSNVMVGEFGEVQVMDWGLAKQVGPGGAPGKTASADGKGAGTESEVAESPGSGDLQSKTGRFLGTPLYAAPEQFPSVIDRRGTDATNPVGKSADVFALGALLCELVTRYSPYLTDQDDPADPSLLGRVKTLISGDRSWPGQERLRTMRTDPTLSPHTTLIQLAEECLARDPALRPPDAGAVAERVGAYQATIRQQAEEGRIKEAQLVEVRKKRRIAMFLALSLGVLLIGTVGATLYYFNLVEEKQKLADENAGLAVKAETRRKESRQRLVRSYLREGKEALDRQDLLGALPWFTEAAREDQENVKNQEIHRVRLASMFRDAPRVAQVFSHEDRVNEVACSPDGRLVAIAAGVEVRVWEAHTGRQVTTPLRFDRGPYPGRPDGDPLAHGREKVGPLPWAARASEPGRFSPMNAVAFSHDGRYLATGGDGAQVWDVATWRAITGPLKHSRPPEGEAFELSGKSSYSVRRVLFSPGGDRLVTLNRSQVIVWDATGKIAKPVECLNVETEIADVCFARNGRTLLVAVDNQILHLDFATGKGGVLPLDHTSRVRQLELSPDGAVLAVVCDDGTVSLRGGKLWKLTHNDPISRAKRIAFSPDGIRFATAGLDGMVTLWEAKTGKRLGDHRASLPTDRPLHSVGFSPDGRFVTAARTDGLVQVWDMITGRQAIPPLAGANKVQPASVVEYEVFAARSRFNTSRFSPDGRHILTATGGDVILWELPPQHGSTRRSTPLSRDTKQKLFEDVECGGKLLGFRLAFSPNRRHLLHIPHLPRLGSQPPVSGASIVGSISSLPGQGSILAAPALFPGIIRQIGGTKARLLDAKTLAPLLPPFLSGGAMYGTFSPDGARLAIAGEDGKAYVWDVDRGELLLTVEHGRNPLWQVVFSPDGRSLATASIDGTARVWDSTGRPVTGALLHGGDIEWITFSPDSQLLLTAGTRSSDGSNKPLGKSLMFRENLKGLARVWEVRSGKTLPLLCMHEKRVTHATFSAHARYVITASDDLTARVWDVRTAKPVSPPFRHSQPVYYATFGADERFVVTSNLPSNDGFGETRVWDAQTGEPITPWLRHRVYYSDHDVRALLRLEDVSAFKKLPSDVAWTMSGLPAAELTADFRLQVRANPFETLTWNLTPDWRPMKCMMVEAQVRSGVHIDVTGTSVLTDMRAAWKELQEEVAPASRASADQVQLAWHRDQADICESSGNGFALLWHLKRLFDGGQRDWQLHYRKGNAYAQLGRWEDAVQEYSYAIKVGKSAWQVWTARGKAHVMLGKLGEGLADAAEALRLDESAAEAYVIRGIAFGVKREYGEALENFTKAIKLEPALWEAWVHRAKSHYDSGRLVEALADWNEAGQLQPGNSWVVCGRADVYRRLGRLKEAEADYTHALVLNVNNWDASFGLGLLQLFKGDVNGYRQTCWEALRRVENNGNVDAADRIVELSVLAPGAQNALALSVRIAERAVAERPGDCKYRHNLGAALYRAGRYADAEREFNKAVKLCARGGTAWDWYFLAMCNRQLGHKALARIMLAKATSAFNDGSMPGARDSDYYANRRLQLQRLNREAAEVLQAKQEDRQPHP
jgi:WD40 repeat protein/serine/threonine protein kinase/tetratricopeptide (TPR) repeat protein